MWKNKTTMQKAKTIISLQDTDIRREYIETANVKLSLLLIRDNPLLIDEWQDIPIIWDAVRMESDNREDNVQFILTGSTAFENNKTMNKGTRRITGLKKYPMSLYE